MTVTKSEMARRLKKRGMSVAAICSTLGMSSGFAHAALSRISREESAALKKAATRALQEKLKGNQPSAHVKVEKFTPTEPPRGRCVAWTVTDGQAKQCGTACKGQLCPEHAHTTIPVVSPLGRRLQS